MCGAQPAFGGPGLWRRETNNCKITIKLIIKKKYNNEIVLKKLSLTLKILSKNFKPFNQFNAIINLNLYIFLFFDRKYLIQFKKFENDYLF